VDCKFSSADRALAARLEAAEADNVTAITRLAAGSVAGVAFEEFAGGAAVFAGAGSPMTHAMGIGMRGAVAESELERMERFFWERGSACLIDLCPLADVSVIAFVESRPYRIVEFNNVLARRIEPAEEFAPAVGVHAVAEDDAALWGRVVSEGFAEYMPVTEEMVQMMTTAGKASQCWLGWDKHGSCPVAGAAINIQNGVAVFSGDASLVSARRKGWQAALIRARLAAAQEQGCELGMVTVLPGSTSHRNYERAGFQLIYMRLNLMRELAGK
jgi:GNAT superfamily N-acetyltransferase